MKQFVVEVRDGGGRVGIYGPHTSEREAGRWAKLFRGEYPDGFVSVRPIQKPAEALRRRA